MADKWDQIAIDVFGRTSYVDFETTCLQDCEFFGSRVQKVHAELADLLTTVESALGVGFGGAPPVSSTFRRRKGMHGFGMAIDFDVIKNPYVLNESGEGSLDNELRVSYDHIVEFMLGVPTSSLRRLALGRANFGTVADLYDVLIGESDAMQQYFQLKDDAIALARYLDNEWRETHPGQAAPNIEAIQLQMREDYEVLGGNDATGRKRPTANPGAIDRPFAPISAGGQGDPMDGFLNLDRDFVVAMTEAGFAWGAIDMGKASGDIQHFDLRFHGKGADVFRKLS